MPDGRLIPGAAVTNDGSHGIHGLRRRRESEKPWHRGEFAHTLDAGRSASPFFADIADLADTTDSPTVHTHDTTRVTPHRSAP